MESIRILFFQYSQDGQDVRSTEASAKEGKKYTYYGEKMTMTHNGEKTTMKVETVEM